MNPFVEWRPFCLRATWISIWSSIRERESFVNGNGSGSSVSPSKSTTTVRCARPTPLISPSTFTPKWLSVPSWNMPSINSSNHEIPCLLNVRRQPYLAVVVGGSTRSLFLICSPPRILQYIRLFRRESLAHSIEPSQVIHSKVQVNRNKKPEKKNKNQFLHSELTFWLYFLTQWAPLRWLGMDINIIPSAVGISVSPIDQFALGSRFHLIPMLARQRDFTTDGLVAQFFLS